MCNTSAVEPCKEVGLRLNFGTFVQLHVIRFGKYE